MLVHNKTVQERASALLLVSMFFVEWWPSFVLGLSGVCSFFISTFPNAIVVHDLWGIDIPIRYVFCFLAIAFTVAGGLGVVKNRRTLTQAEKELRQNKTFVRRYFDDVEKVLQIVLLQLAADCDLVERERCKPEVRITLYCHDAKNCRFVPVARVAGDPTFEEMGRSSYPNDQGVISFAWQKGVAKFKSNSKNSDEWVDEMINFFGFDRKVAENLKMQSRSMLAIRLDHHGKHVGVTVIESIMKTGKCSADSSLADVILEGMWYAPVANLVDAVHGSHVARVSSQKPC